MEDIYDEYPELRSIQSRRRKSGRKRLSNSGKLAILLLVIALALVLTGVVVSRLSRPVYLVFDKEGKVLEIGEGETEKYLDQGYYKNAADLAKVKLYAADGSVATACRGDAELLEKRGYYADITKAFVTLYDDGGQTMYVPASLADSYISKGWHDKLGDVTAVLYKEDASKITVLKSEAEKYIEQGWSDRLFSVAKKMVSPEGEERIVFNNDVGSYLDGGWSIVKRAIDPSAPMLALTFDDGPGKYTAALLDLLEKHNSAATFFVVGSNVEKYGDVLVRASKLGCEIGNHTWNHDNITSMSLQEGKDTLKKTSDAVREITGKPTLLYRPCFGAYNSKLLAQLEQTAVMWSLDTLDWKTMNAASTYDKVVNNAYDGAIVLMHDIHRPTLEAMERLIPKLVEDGWQLVTVSELMEYRLGGMESGKAYYDINDIK